VSEDLAGRILALPIHPYLSETQIAQVCDSVLAAVS
jgi:UDP-2-acetamido-2-deoxy-ribo-hexuluronate aminotransferase